MKIAVVGGAGFIGKEFVQYAESKNHQTVVIGSNYDVFSKEGEFQVRELLRDCDSMVFLAARRSTPIFEFKDYLYNIELAGKYMELALACTIKNIVLRKR